MLACRYMVLTNTEIAPLPAPILRSACPLHPTPALLLLLLPVASPCPPNPPTPSPAALFCYRGGPGGSSCCSGGQDGQDGCPGGGNGGGMVGRSGQ